MTDELFHDVADDYDPDDELFPEFNRPGRDTRLATVDREGRRHRGKGPGGGQFTGTAGDDGGRPVGKPAAHPGAAHGSTVTVQATQQRAFRGAPAQLSTTLTKQETGRVGEAVVLAWLKAQGFVDAGPMNSSQTNFPMDLIEDHRPTEVKAGLASNSRKAQQWRLTFSKESATEKALYATMTPAERAAWNAEKQARIRQRKQQAIGALERRNPGTTIRPRTIAVILDPDAQTADVYEFDGFHDRIDWQSAAAQAAYRGSVVYDH